MKNELDFSGRSALITGAASGIGAASAKWLDQSGIGKLILIDKDADGLAAMELSCDTELHTADVSDEGFWNGLDVTLDSLDHAIVNAGIGAFAPIADHTFSDWRKVMSVNLDGAFLTLRTALRAMKKSGGGSAVLVASITGHKAVPAIGAYGVAKAGVSHMARLAAAEGAADKIRVNAIAPGGVDTAIWDAGEAFQKMVEEQGREAALQALAVGTPRGKLATSDEIAGNIGYLLSDAAANITGTVQISDGGFSL
ncbi:SDR family oxidoreductase [Pontixanthobacter aestiaquae]|uniref:SDR family oxidoreductase n=1 Tax=Pontixanthobacter aestiaquae TaxID=1509367 RepID=A0A844Z824_9SPHN|nr:SDR family oxidoreductase [Pontixanthobacter aestiaquae]MDN3645923.1 SDR family oxidoreductase [Pontixanthobacter aestiaquae]MXO83083.1 SDR family oxidoreductase [Pontixanthobacter aestiaquae]